MIFLIYFLLLSAENELGGVSLVPRLSPRTTTMNSKEGESLVPFRT